MVVLSGFSLGDLDVLQEASSILGRANDSGYHLEDFPVLSRASKLLGSTISDLPRHLGADALEPTRSHGKQRITDPTPPDIEIEESALAAPIHRQAQNVPNGNFRSHIPTPIETYVTPTSTQVSHAVIAQVPISSWSTDVSQNLDEYGLQSNEQNTWNSFGEINGDPQDVSLNPLNDFSGANNGMPPLPYNVDGAQVTNEADEWDWRNLFPPLIGDSGYDQLQSDGSDPIVPPLPQTLNAQPGPSQYGRIEDIETAPNEGYLTAVQDLSHDSSSGAEEQQRTPSASDESTSQDRPQFKAIAPKPPNSTSRVNISTQALTQKTLLLEARVPKSRATGRRRQCVRCRMQKKKCIQHPTRPQGPCVECDKVQSAIIPIPCFCNTITESILFRSGTWNDPFEVSHPMVGKKYGDFYVEREWVASDPKILYIEQQDHGLVLGIKVREFVPPDEYVTDDKGLFGGVGRSVYAIPWGVADPGEELQKLKEQVDRAIGNYLNSILDQNDPLIWNVYREGYRLSRSAQPSLFLKNVFRLWTGMRLLEGGWRCCGPDTLASESVRNELRPAPWISPPSFVDHQFFSIVMHRYLGPLREKVLKTLQYLILHKDSRHHWYTIFLGCFILLHSNELLMAWIRRHAVKRNAPVKYLYVELVRAMHSTTKTILAHFHYGLKGQIPFQQDFDWKGSAVRRMADLDQDQVDFMQDYTRIIQQKTETFRALNQSHEYDAKYWFVSQLFERKWVPRETLEHAPPV